MLELDKQKKDMALVLEIFFGLFFIMGAGWVYAGNKTRGGVLLAGSLLAGAPAMFSLILATGGIGVFCCALPTYLLMVTDILALRKWMENPKIETPEAMLKTGCILMVGWLIFMAVGIFGLIQMLPNLVEFFEHGFG
jgi:hypothetical protein